MKKQFLSGLLLMVLSGSAWAVDIGVGIDDSKSILVPIKFTDGFMMELSYKSWYSDARYSASRSTSKKYNDVGLGLFGLVQTESPVEYYYGLRINVEGYEREEFGSTNRRGTEENTFKFTPLVGVLYSFDSRLSLGLEANYYIWSRLKTYENSPLDINYSYSGTDTRIVARVMF